MHTEIGLELKNELQARRPIEKLQIKTTVPEPKTLFKLCNIVERGFVMHVGLLLTESSMKAYSTCREETIGYEIKRNIRAPEKLIVSSSLCGVK